MPYKLRKKPRHDLYWVVSTETGRKHSKEALPKERAEAQMRALYSAMHREGGGAYDIALMRNPKMFAEAKRDFLDKGHAAAQRAKKINEETEAYHASQPTFETWAGPVNAALDLAGLIPGIGTVAGITKEAMSHFSGKGPRPERPTLQKITKEAYSKKAPAEVDELQLIDETPTLKFYMDPKDNTIVVGIRGTVPTDSADVKADAMIAIGSLEKSARYKKDLQKIIEFQKRYPPSVYDYYGVGHSLGGAILDSFIEHGYLISGLSYNPAVQLKHVLNENLANERIYAENDPLYNTYKNFLKKTPEVRRAKRSTFQQIARHVPYVGKIYDTLQGHLLDQFSGGRKKKVHYHYL